MDENYYNNLNIKAWKLDSQKSPSDPNNRWDDPLLNLQ